MFPQVERERTVLHQERCLVEEWCRSTPEGQRSSNLVGLDRVGAGRPNSGAGSAGPGGGLATGFTSIVRDNANVK